MDATQATAQMMVHSPNLEGIVALLIPIVAIVMGIGIGMLGLWLDYRKKREIFGLHHQERMAAIEKGMEVPPLPPEFFADYRRRRPRTPADSLRRGLILLMGGIALTIALYAQHRAAALWGLIPAAVGVAQLLFYFLEGRRAPPPAPDASANGTRR